MNLSDIGKSPDSTFRRINQHLETNYGFKISEDVTDKDLVAIMEQIEEEITELKIKGDDARGSSEISKRLLVLEGVRNLREFAMMQFQSPDLDRVLEGLSDFVCEHFRLAGCSQADYEEGIRDAMKYYRSSKYRFPDDLVEQRVRQMSMSKINGQPTGELGVPIPQPVLPMMEDDETDETDEAQGDSEMKGIDEDGPMSKDDYMSRKKTLQGIQMNPQTSRDPLMKKELARKSAELNQQGRAAGHVTDEAEEDPYGSVGKRSSGLGGYAASVPNTPQARHAMKVLDNPSLELNPQDQTPMIRDKHGRMVPDPFAAQAAARRKGIVMKEHANLVKNLRRLLETEVSQAEVMMAAKGFAQELQEMVEKIGRLQNEDLPPVTDQMRETYGMESASAFQTQIYGALQMIMDSLYTAKTQVDDAVGNMASTGQVSAQTDMDKDLGMDDMDGMDSEMPPEDMGGEEDLDNIGAELDAEPEDEFGAEEDLGREMKTESLQRRVTEMKKLVAKAKKLKESRK